MKRKLAMFAGMTAIAAVGAFVLLSAPWRPAMVAPVIPSSDAPQAFPEGATVEVQYIANEGVLISSRDKRILIDGLHRKYDDAYAYLPDGERDKIESARPPFDKVDLILVSHMHGDHFHPESVGRYLVSSPSTILATSEQIVAEIESKFADHRSIKERITPVVYDFKGRETRKLAGVDVEVLSVGHGTGRHAQIQNLGHIFSLGGKKFLHLGDAVPSPEVFDHYDLEKQSIDVAFMPAWFLTSEAGRAIVREHIRPKHIIAVHVGPAETESIRRQVKNEFPTADVFGTLLEKRSF